MGLRSASVMAMAIVAKVHSVGTGPDWGRRSRQRADKTNASNTLPTKSCSQKAQYCTLNAGEDSAATRQWFVQITSLFLQPLQSGLIPHPSYITRTIRRYLYRYSGPHVFFTQYLRSLAGVYVRSVRQAGVACPTATADWLNGCWFIGLSAIFCRRRCLCLAASFSPTSRDWTTN